MGRSSLVFPSQRIFQMNREMENPNELKYKPWSIPANANIAFTKDFFKNVSSSSMELRPGLVDVQGKSKRDKYITPLRDSILVTMLDKISKDDSFRIDGVSKGSEKEVAQKKLFSEIFVDESGNWETIVAIDQIKVDTSKYRLDYNSTTNYYNTILQYTIM